MARIFIVEDDANLASIYKKELESGGHKAEIVADVESVDRIKKEKPDLVLLDIMMTISGLDILREVKNDAEVSNIPVLLLTNVADESAIEKGLEYGAEGYLLKSEVTPDQILTRVNSTLESSAPPV